MGGFQILGIGVARYAYLSAVFFEKPFAPG